MQEKIGILTFHHVPNYGAVLQAYALKTYLQNTANADVSVIDFQCRGNSAAFEPSRYCKTVTASGNLLKKAAKTVLVRAFAQNAYQKKYHAFSEFFKEELPQAPYSAGIYEDYDYLFCGSDQIWNDEITDGFQMPYFGADRPQGSRAVVSAYAASCGDIADFDEAKKRALFALVSGMDHVGVREKSLAEALQAQGIAAVNTVDPTFLLTKEEYISALGLKPRHPQKYIVQYELKKDPALDALAAKISGEKGLPIVKICGYMRMSCEKGIFDIGPRQFLEWMASAEYVVTNSFHGTAFSLIFEKDFNVLLPASRKGRLTDLLRSVGLTDRICTVPQETDRTSIDYQQVMPRLAEEIRGSKQYIDRILRKDRTNNE